MVRIKECDYWIDKNNFDTIQTVVKDIKGVNSHFSNNGKSLKCNICLFDIHKPRLTSTLSSVVESNVLKDYAKYLGADTISLNTKLYHSNALLWFTLLRSKNTI
uniref:Uncharacterized protein n=1 Tax=viral metagenome TaxID=1070528 RepID=A0A6C0CJS0_9ZZZZ